jgi:hypothetical protein
VKRRRIGSGRFGFEGTPFTSAEEAWFWTMGALRARQNGFSRGGSGRNAPCTPDDVLRCLERLYRDQRIDAAHAQVLQIWGERQMAPDGGHRGNGERALWREAMERLWPLLQEKGIVGW